MDDVILARVIHVVGVVVWIGGVAMVTLVLLPAVRDLSAPEDRIRMFERIESRFARQVRWTTLATGASGFWIAARLGLWPRFESASYWWMHAMVALWTVFMLMLFVLEPLWLHRWFEAAARRRPDATFALVRRLHWVLFAAGIATIGGAVAGSHGGL